MLIAKPLEHPLRHVPLLSMDLALTFQPSMISVNPSSFGRFIGAVRQYPGGTENANFFRTLSREIPNRRAASRWHMPSEQARRTFR